MTDFLTEQAYEAIRRDEEKAARRRAAEAERDSERDAGGLVKRYDDEVVTIGSRDTGGTDPARDPFAIDTRKWAVETAIRSGAVGETDVVKTAKAFTEFVDPRAGTEPAPTD